MAADQFDNLANQLAEGADGADGAKKESEAAASPEDENHDRNLAMILDIPLRVTVELGRTKMPVSELLNLAQGSVIELNKLAGEPMEVFVNDKLIARGEAVVVNEKFGVRLTDIISTRERVEQLK
ncbi:MAG: flagellar motor switch protein FliN [Bdellovibrionaceae bacterium]|nr:flagellar motor switch protein FliN [Pseudobdellovibrionaceae bacterium]